MNSFPCSRSDCDNKTEYGYCKSTVCIKPMNLAVGYIPDVAITEVAPVVHARWEKRMEQRKGNGYEAYTPVWKCSVCGKDYDPATALIVNYCPNCGAKMDVEGEAQG